MNADRWNRIATLFEAALDLRPEERRGFLREACGQDSGLRRELESMLDHDAGAEGRLGGIVARAVEEGSEPGRRIGPYRVISEIGRGGMGIVYLAHRADDEFEQQVAIKLVSHGMHTEAARGRFLRERQLLANLNHPYIARLLDGGSTDDGQPFFAMEYVHGRPITVFADEERLAINQRLDLFLKVCEAVQYAHRNLVVHRDLKPNHILVTDEGAPKLLDFGIAKALDREQRLAATIPILTPDYASPEQVRGGAITTATDVYSLGAVLYELLTGERPHQFDTQSPGELERVICYEEPRRPSVAAGAAWAAAIRGDLDHIVLMALRKEPERRYGSVEQFAADIRRLLEGRPVMARDATVGYRAAKFVRRHRFALAAAMLVLMTLAGGVIAAKREARRSERRFEQVRRLANTFLFDLDEQIQTLPGSTKVREAMVGTALQYLDSLAEESGDDRALQFELASAYQKIGDVQGYGMRPNLGQVQLALQSHRKALVIAERLAARDPNPKVERLLAHACHRVGYLLRANRQIAPALDHFRKGLAIAERLYAAEPGNPEDSPLLIEIAGHLAATESAAGDPGSAAQRSRRMLEVAQRWAAVQPGERSQSAVGDGYLRMARALMQTGDLGAAERHAREAVAIEEDLVRREPANSQYRRNLLNSYEMLGYIANDPYFPSFGDHAAAVLYHRKAMAVAEQLAAADPTNMTALSDLAITHRNVCFSLVDEDPVRAAEEGRRALDMKVRVPAGTPVREAICRALALSKLARQGEALAILRKALAVQEQAGAARTDRIDDRLWMLRIHNQTGAILLDMNDPQGAIEEHRQALAIIEELVTSHPSYLELRLDQADCYEALGRAYAALGERRHSVEHWREARDWRQKSLDVWSHWTQWGVSSVFNTRREEAARKALAQSESAMAANK